MTPDRPTFSPLWHRVRALKPRLRPHVQITRQFYRGRRWHVVHDPASNQFYRLSPVAHELVGLLDGARTVEEAWNLSLETNGDAAPTQGEVIEMLGQMYGSNLLAVDVTPETEQLLSRGKERIKRRLASQAIGIMYFRIRLFNPDRYLSWLTPILKPLINPVGFLLWIAWVGWGLAVALPHWDELKTAFDEAIAPAHWLGLWIVFLVIKGIHETGHGVICKRFGGQVPEFGAMFLVLLPSPYVDASSAWGFSSKWRRAAVGAGGMIFELTVAAAAAHYWVSTLNNPGSLAHRLAFNAMFTASVTTVLFNANPLMRFDGYYILSDLIEVPNLMQRSMRMLQHVAQKYIYRVERTRAPSTVPSEQAILVVYGVLALAYRLFLFVSITLYMMGKLFAIGLILAVWTAVAWFAIPLGKFLHWLAAGPQIAENRGRAVLVSGALAAAALVGTGIVPVPDHRRAAGVIESANRTGVFFKTDGFITAAHVRAGDHVKAGDPIMTSENGDLVRYLELSRAQLSEYQALERQYLTQNPAAAQVARTRIENHTKLIAILEERVANLVLRAPHDGIVVPGVGGVDPASVVGMYAQRGQMLCEVVDPAHVRVAATISNADAQPLLAIETGFGQGGRKAQIRPYRHPDDVFTASAVRILPAGQKKLPHPALGYSGGGVVETDPQDKQGLAAKTPQFTAYLEADGLGLPGERVKVRFSLPWRPLLDQWIDRVRRKIQGRVDI
jgi:putative peptide zinc metalloprotease protein